MGASSSSSSSSKLKVRITEDKLFTKEYKFAQVCDVTSYIKKIFHCKDLKRATAVANHCYYRDDCFLKEVNVNGNCLTFDMIIIEFTDGSISQLSTTEDMYIEIIKAATK